MQHLSKSDREDIIANLLVLLDNVPQERMPILEKYLVAGDKKSLFRLKQDLGLSGLAYSALAGFVRNKELYGEYHVLALKTALALKNQLSESADNCELIWTGPIRFEVPARNTMSIMKEMIIGAQKNVTIVGYRVQEYAAPLVKLLHDAMNRDVNLTLVLDRPDDQLALFRKIWKKNRLPHVYTRVPNKDDPMEALHAKLIICDHSDLLVTSANLTYHGLSANIEIGVRITGKTAEKAQLLINSLIRSGDLQEVVS